VADRERSERITAADRPPVDAVLDYLDPLYRAARKEQQR
jgi:hypothetical protein